MSDIRFSREMMSPKVWLFRHIPLFRRLGSLKDAPSVIGENWQMRRAFDCYCDGDIPPVLDSEARSVFKAAFAKFNWQQHRQKRLWQKFIECDMSLVKNAVGPIPEPNSPIAVCIIKDDMARLPSFLEHYRSLGILRFAFMDNGSTDGTFELLCEQPDVDLWLSRTSYETERREAWITRLLAHYGFDRWYLCVDSDELFVYTDCETTPIGEFVEACQRRGERRARSLMIDMYSNEPMPLADDGEDIRKTYRYFDIGPYTTVAKEKLDEVRGGPRSRMLSSGGAAKYLLTKYPLFRFTRGDIQGFSHFQFPYDENYGLECRGALLHYKFLANDMEKYIQRANQGNYASGSLEYKEYARRFGNGRKVVFYDPAVSRPYDSSKSLRQIKELTEWR